MERPRLVPQVYGYAVCLVSVITILVASNSVIDAAFDAASPEMSRDVMYSVERAPAVAVGDRTSAPTEQATTDAATRGREEAARSERIALARHQGIRRLVGSGTTLLIAIGFFLMHWRWLRGMARTEPA